MAFQSNNPSLQVVDCGTATIDAGTNSITFSTETQKTGDILIHSKTNQGEWKESYIATAGVASAKITQEALAVAKASYAWALLREG